MWLKWHDIDYPKTAQFAETPPVGTKLPNRDVRSTVATGVKPDTTRTTQLAQE
jgi:hypothetical protein